jgi:hypothetical protein
MGQMTLYAVIVLEIVFFDAKGWAHSKHLADAF